MSANLKSSQIVGESYFVITWRQFKKNKISIIAFYIMIFLFFIAIFAPFIANDKPIIAYTRFLEQYEYIYLNILKSLDFYLRDIIAYEGNQKKIIEMEKEYERIQNSAIKISKDLQQVKIERDNYKEYLEKKGIKEYIKDPYYKDLLEKEPKLIEEYRLKNKDLTKLRETLKRYKYLVDFKAHEIGILSNIEKLKLPLDSSIKDYLDIFKIEFQKLFLLNNSRDKNWDKEAFQKEFNLLAQDFKEEFDFEKRKSLISYKYYFPILYTLTPYDIFFQSLFIFSLLFPLFKKWIKKFGTHFIHYPLYFIGLPIIVVFIFFSFIPSGYSNEDYKRSFLRSINTNPNTSKDWAIFPPIIFSPEESRFVEYYQRPPIEDYIKKLSCKFFKVSCNHENLSGEINKKHYLGTDDVGRDILARLIWGARISLTVGFVSISIALLIGTILGALAGYFGGIIDLIISRLIEVVLCFPTLFLILSILAFLEQSIFNVMIVIGFTGWTQVARLTRGEFLRLRQADFVLAGKALGLSDFRIIFRHILPNAMTPILVVATFGIASAILYEATLSFLGLGVPPPTPSWGQMLSELRGTPSDYWWLFAPGFAIFLSVTVYNLVGEGFRDASDPRLRR